MPNGSFSPQWTNSTSSKMASTRVRQPIRLPGLAMRCYLLFKIGEFPHFTLAIGKLTSRRVLERRRLPAD